MSDIFWPSDLPAMLVGTSYTPVNPRLETQLSSGRTIARPWFTAVPENFSGSWTMNNDEAIRFESFYWSDTKAGTLWFYMPTWIPQDLGGDRLVRFNGIYTRTPIKVNGTGCGLWTYSCEMQLYLTYTE